MTDSTFFCWTAVKNYIKNGDIYQANLTREITGKTEYSPIEIAYKLYHSNSIEFGVFAKN